MHTTTNKQKQIEMDIKDLGQLKEMQKRLLKKQCDLDIQKAMVKAFIKKEESKKLTSNRCYPKT